jgi:hypothetical protein
MLANVQDRVTLTAAHVTGGDFWWMQRPWDRVPQYKLGIEGTGQERTPEEEWNLHHFSALLCQAQTGLPVRWGAVLTLGLVSPRLTGLMELETFVQGVKRATLSWPAGIPCSLGFALCLMAGSFADTDLLYVTATYRRRERGRYA